MFCLGDDATVVRKPSLSFESLFTDSELKKKRGKKKEKLENLEYELPWRGVVVSFSMPYNTRRGSAPFSLCRK